jgi:putative ABC transport system permease protein
MIAPVAPQEFLLGHDYLDWHDRQTPFESMGYWSWVGDYDLEESENPVRLRCGYVSGSLLPTLGIAPMAGRNFSAAETVTNGPKAALLSYGLWRGRFAGDRNAVGKTVPLDGQALTIVGVLPPGFELPDLSSADVLLPHMMDEALQRSRKVATLVYAVARLKPGLGPRRRYSRFSRHP